jgi:hypothetical protein
MSDRRSYPRPLTMILHHLLRALPESAGDVRSENRDWASD